MRKVVKNVILVLLILTFLTLSFSTVLLSYLYFFASDDKPLSGEWIAELDMTEHAVFTALGWLQEIEAVSISQEEMETYMQNLTIQINLTLEQTAQAGGTFQCSVVPESYDSCSQAAYEAFARAFQELLARRLLMAGYLGSTDEDAIEALVTETFGMSTVSYLMSCAPALLPSLEELQAQYEGNGTYETAENILTWQFGNDGDGMTRAEYYIKNDIHLILTEEVIPGGDDLQDEYYPVIYTLKNAQD